MAELNAQMGLLGYLSLCLAPLRTAAQSEQQLRELAATVGWDLDQITGLPLDELRAVLDDVLAGVDELLLRADRPPRTLDELGQALSAAEQAFDAVRSIPAILAPGSRPTHFEEFAEDLIEALVTNHLQHAQPAAFALAVLLTLIEPADRRALEPAVLDAAGNLVRFPHTRHRLQLDRLADLLEDPGAVLHAAYVGDGELVTAADARRVADRLFPRIAALLTALGLRATYGTKPVYGIDLADPDHLAGGSLTCWMTPQASDVSGGMTFSLSPREQGDLGLVVAPFGALTLEQSFEHWALKLDVSAGFDALAVGPQGVKLLATPGSGATSFGARAAAVRLPAAGGSRALVGSTTGSRLELAQLGIFAAAALSDSEREFTVDLEVPAAALVVAPSDGDGFLAAILPRDGARVDFRIAVGWSSTSGLRFRGGAGLELQVPVGAALGPLSIDALGLAVGAADGRVKVAVGTTLGVRLGPVKAVVSGIGLEAAITTQERGNLGPLDLDLGFKTPTGVGLAIDAGRVKGSGFLGYDEAREQYAGRVQLQFEGLAVKATGLLTTRLPDGSDGFSLLVVISAEFPPVQLGLGFELVAVGGLLAINRTVAVDTLRAGLKSGVLGAVLSPPDPAANAAGLLATLDTLFPRAAGRHVFGPTARIVWRGLITIDVCLLLELPAPVRLVVLGRLRAVLPSEREPVAVLQMDLLGVIDFDRRTAAVDATLVDSRLDSFALTGDMAMRMSWGAESSFLLAVGGFHPRFAAPPGFPALQRVAVALASGKNPRLRLEAYLALTSNTIQLGARVDLSARAGRFEVAGFLSFDALVQLSPLAFEVEIAAKLAVRAGGHTILSVSLKLTLSGPAPWRARGRASFSLLFFDVTFSFDVTIGSEPPPELPAAVDVGALVHAALSDPRSWLASPPARGDTLVSLRAAGPADGLLAHPLAALEVRQRVAPLERTLERFGTNLPAGAARFAITSATIAGAGARVDPLQDLFAPGDFSELTDEQRLSSPSFAAMASGARVGEQDPVHGAPTVASMTFEQRVWAADGVPDPPPARTDLPGDLLVLLATAAPSVPRPVFALRP